MSDGELTFRCMASDVRLVVPATDRSELAGARRWLEDFDRRMSRFRSDSELSRLNRDPREEVPASRLLLATVGACLWAAHQTGGLVDPTITPALERLGYRESRDGVAPPPLGEALGHAPARRAATPSPAAPWRSVAVDEVAGVVRRPRGVRLDSGGVGKGLAADAVAHRLTRLTRFAVDCGGDVRVGGAGARAEPFEVVVEHPLNGEVAHRFWLGAGAVATSGLNARVWRRPDGTYAHHLVDPSTGRSAWTGLIGATALAPTALEAETLAKAALLSGIAGGRSTLAEHGGLLVHDSGKVELVGRMAWGMAA